MTDQEATSLCQQAACPDSHRVPQDHTEACVRRILPPGNGQRSEAVINGHHVKRQAARYLIDGRTPAYSVEDAVQALTQGLASALNQGGTQ